MSLRSKAAGARILRALLPLCMLGLTTAPLALADDQSGNDQGAPAPRSGAVVFCAVPNGDAEALVDCAQLCIEGRVDAMLLVDPQSGEVLATSDPCGVGPIGGPREEKET